MRNARAQGEKEPHSQKVVRCLGNFMRRNRCLQYIDLDSTGLSHKVMVDLVPQM
jgi:hypothetical protein